MKKLILFVGITFLIHSSCIGQQKIKDLIYSNLNSRYTSFEIVSITQDSCPNMSNLFNLSLTLRIVASECKVNISKATLSYYKDGISLEKTSELCKKEINRINTLAKEWESEFFSKSERCLRVKYRYGNAAGIKTTVEEYFSLNENKYKEGNYPYMKKEFNESYGFNLYKEVAESYQEFLLEIVRS